MKDVYEVLQQKALNVQRVQKEIAALHSVIPLLLDDGDFIEWGLAKPLTSSPKASQERNVANKRAGYG